MLFFFSNFLGSLTSYSIPRQNFSLLITRSTTFHAVSLHVMWVLLTCSFVRPLFALHMVIVAITTTHATCSSTHIQRKQWLTVTITIIGSHCFFTPRDHILATYNTQQQNQTNSFYNFIINNNVPFTFTYTTAKRAMCVQ